MGLSIIKSLHRPHVAWYTFSLRHLELPVLVTAIFISLLLVTVSEKHCWQWEWSKGPLGWRDCQPVIDANGHRVEGWRWVEGGQINVWVPASFSAYRAQHVRDYVASLVNDVGAPVSVHVATAPPRVLDALAVATEKGKGQPTVDFDQLCRLLVASRKSAAADFVVAPFGVSGDANTVGAACFSYGVGYLNADVDGPLYARHETAHLLGYNLHDDWPIVVLGYPVHERNGTLMSPVPGSEQLSDRARDAIRAFWSTLPMRVARDKAHSPYRVAETPPTMMSALTPKH